MASSSKLYTCGCMEKIEVDNITSEDTGYEKQYMLDFNNATYWKPTSTANQTIDVDLQAAKTIDGLILFVHNYDTDHDNSGTSGITISGDDNASFTSPEQLASVAFENAGTPGDPLYLFIGSSALTYRYWRILIASMGTTIEISQLLLVREYEISIGNQWPENDSDVYQNQVTNIAGRSLINRQRRTKIRTFPRQWQLAATDWAALQNAFNDSGGNLWPLVLQEGSNNYLVRFRDAELAKNEILYQIYQPTAVFDELPYIEDGEVF